jgi:SAM-dependent MidA family methyltransferase
LRRAVDLVERGSVLVIDYAVDATAELAERPVGEWVRTYASHGSGGGPLDAVGRQDVTVEVALDQLTAVAAPSVTDTQSDWLRRWGIDELVDEGRRIWDERAGAGDLAAIRARSRIVEADALCDPTGLGAFRVVEWHRP